jgi:hypothetical protein
MVATPTQRGVVASPAARLEPWSVGVARQARFWTTPRLRGLRATLARHTTRDGALFGACTWIITARTPRQEPVQA